MSWQRYACENRDIVVLYVEVALTGSRWAAHMHGEKKRERMLCNFNDDIHRVLASVNQDYWMKLAVIRQSGCTSLAVSVME